MDLEAALEEVAPRLLAYAIGRTGSRSAAEDVVQDALAALVRRWRNSGPPESVDAFVFSIAKRRATRANVKRALAVPLERVGMHLARPAFVVQHMEARDELAHVLEAIRSLGGRDREVLLMRAAGEMSIADIAVALGVSSDAVKMRLSRARDRVRRQLKGDGHAGG